MTENSSGEMEEVLNSNDEVLYQLEEDKDITVKAEEDIEADLRLTKNSVQ